jgi:hypothetical protein
MPYEVDHEVAVQLEDAGAAANGNKKVTITATSLDHEITKLVVWSNRGKNAKEINTVNNPTNKTVKFRDTHDTEIKTAHQVKDPEEIPNDDWPICIDVYEAGVEDGEAPDVHRHGWFKKNLDPEAAKDHPVNKPTETWKQPFYPMMVEEKAPKSGTLPGPDPHEKPTKKKP